MSMSSQFFIVLVCSVLGGVFGQGKTPYDWREAPYDNDDFNTRVHYTRDANLTCTDERIANMTDTFEVKMWITPRLEVLYPGAEPLEFDTLDGTAGWTVSNDGRHMYITLTHDFHFGIYYCVLQSLNTTQTYVVKTAINFRGAYWGNTWWRYETATIWSLVGSAICGAIFAIGAFIYTRFDSAEDDITTAGDEDDFDAILAKLGYNNDAYGDGDGYVNGGPGSDMQIRESHQPAVCPPPEDPPQSPSGGYDMPIPVNDELPEPYETVVEINGRKSRTNTGGNESVKMSELGKTPTDSASVEITADVKL